MAIIWSDDALQDYDENIRYLIREWSEESASDFIDEVESVLNLLEINPELFPHSGFKTIRRAVIRKQITLYYLINNDMNIYLVRFWNTYQNPDSLQFP